MIQTRFYLLNLPKIVKTKVVNMLFSERIKELRMQNKLPQRHLAAALDIDTATYCKIEKGERKAKRNQVCILSNLLHVKQEDLIVLWLADKVSDIVFSEKPVAMDVLSVVVENLKQTCNVTEKR